MSKETREHISSLMDGEISRETSRFLVRRLGTDEELCATWARYHLVRDCLRNQDGGLAREDLCTRIRSEIENDDVRQAPRRTAAGWLKPVAGVAIAASVALMAVMAVDPGTSPALQAPGAVSQGVAAEAFSSPQGISDSTVASQTVSTRQMNQYLLRHYQAAGNGGGRTFVRFVPVMVNSQASRAESTEPDSEADGSETANSTDPR